MQSHIIRRQLKDNALLFQRNTDGTRNDKGRFTGATHTRTPVRCNRQPAEGQIRMPDQSGLRQEQVEVFHLEHAVKSIQANVDGDSRGDVLVHNGLVYQVQAVENWDDYYRAECVLVDPQPDTVPA